MSLRADGSLSLGSPLVARLAGAESNVAIGLARLGHRVQYAGRISTDRFGDEIVRTLRDEGVDVGHVVRDEAPTGVMLVEQRTADVTLVEYRRAGSAASRTQIGDLAAAVAEKPRLVHVTGITPALSASAREAVRAVVEVAHDQGSFTSLDVNHRSRLWSRDDARAVLRPLLEHIDVVIASADELALVSGGDDDDENAAAMALLDAGVGAVAITRGGAGASLLTHIGRDDLPAVPVTAVDPLGAGDAFAAGLISGILDRLDPAGQLHRAVVLGAFAVSTPGDWEGLPRRDELDLIRTHRPGDIVR